MLFAIELGDMGKNFNILNYQKAYSHVFHLDVPCVMTISPHLSADYFPSKG